MMVSLLYLQGRNCITVARRSYILIQLHVRKYSNETVMYSVCGMYA